jgi:Flp pilus assembly protein TadG
VDRAHDPGCPSRRLRGDGGLAIVEFAIAAPLLALFIAGIIEFGMAWRDNLTVSSATRSAARVVSNLGDNEMADLEALLTLRAALAPLDSSQLEGVLIYDGSAADGQPSPACFDAGGNPQPSAVGNCNYYTAAMLTSLDPANFGSGGSCGAWDWFYCSVTERSTNQVSLDDVGVWVRINRDWFTDVFPGDGITMEDRTVMRVEPST